MAIIIERALGEEVISIERLCGAACRKNRTAVELLDELIQYVTEHQLKPGKSLRRQLEVVLAAVNAGDNASACSALKEFVKHVNAQSGKKLPTSAATNLREGAMKIAALLGCD